MITVGIYTDPPPRVLVAVLELSALPAVGHLVDVGQSELASPSDAGAGTWQVHQVIHSTYGVTLLAHPAPQP